MARLLTPPSHHPWPIGAPARPVEGHRAKRKPFEVKSTLIGVESSLVRSVSKQISHSHSPRRRLTIGSAFPTRSGRVSDKLPRKKRRFAVLREIRHHFARFLQLRVIAILDKIKNEKKIDEGESDDQDEPSDLLPQDDSDWEEDDPDDEGIIYVK
ncbi:hypothetical protein Acr_09g0009120 [Actinidia rufa]|uniref:Uncharacterized protein n=1 Tax=Actinidia rufa TaxID=165716 RepID=A0A7J0F7R8_9ERIC|nr:hypothetical protein Acr_09g0009120 [Actinidia rufa]